MSRRAAYLLAVRKRDGRTEVLLEQRAQEASLMAGMFELPPLPLDGGEWALAGAAGAACDYGYELCG